MELVFMRSCPVGEIRLLNVAAFGRPTGVIISS
jgi:hypothetical protein